MSYLKGLKLKILEEISLNTPHSADDIKLLYDNVGRSIDKTIENILIADVLNISFESALNIKELWEDVKEFRITYIDGKKETIKK